MLPPPPDNFFAALSRVLASTLSPNERLLAIVLLSYWSRETPSPYPSVTTLQARTGLARSTVSLTLRSLREKGALRWDSRRARSGAQPINHYDLRPLWTLPEANADGMPADGTEYTDSRHSGIPTAGIRRAGSRHTGVPLDGIGHTETRHTGMPTAGPYPSRDPSKEPSTTQGGGGDAPPKSEVRASEPPRQAEPNPRSLSAVLAMPIAERANWYLANLHQFLGGASDWAQAHTWPELVEAVTALHETAKLEVPAKLRPYAVDQRVKLLLSHYSVGHSREDVVAVYRDIPKSEWWTEKRAEGKRPDASFVTTRVFEITLNKLRDGGKDAAAATKELARVRGARRLAASSPSSQTFPREPERPSPIMAPPASAFAALRAVGGNS